MLQADQPVRVNLAGIQVGSVIFILFSFRGVDEVEVTEDQITPK